jgi:hypothetical protein
MRAFVTAPSAAPAALKVTATIEIGRACLFCLNDDLDFDRVGARR